MDRLLVNLAIVKVNWDSSRDAGIDNYIPFAVHALKQCENDVLSLDNFDEEFQKCANFKMPKAGLMTLLNRISKKHKAIVESRRVYTINRSKLPADDYSSQKQDQDLVYTRLFERFRAYCKKEIDVVLQDDFASTQQYFFGVLYEIAPKLVGSAHENYSGAKRSDEKDYLVSRFIQHVRSEDAESYRAVESFVKGAMLTETFYYQAPEEVQRKFKDITVFLDTSLLLKALKLGKKEETLPAHELVLMLRELNVPIKYFDKTQNELHGILHACMLDIKANGRSTRAGPGSVGEYFNVSGASASDVMVSRDMFVDQLALLGIEMENSPALLKKYSMNEAGLDLAVQAAIPGQNENSRKHDVECIRQIFHYRSGKIHRKLAECKAIFVTDNGTLASSSAKFMNAEYGHSDTPLCIPDYVFTTLVWLKTALKKPDLPIEIVVANCLAALKPSQELWDKYLKEARRLSDKGSVTQAEYELMIHSGHNQTFLMEETIGDIGRISGSVEKVLERAKSEILEEVKRDNNDLKKNINREKEHLRRIEEGNTVKIKAIEEENAAQILALKEENQAQVQRLAAKVNYLLLAALVVVIFFGASQVSSSSSKILIKISVWLVLLFTIVNLLFGVYLDSYTKRASSWLAKYILAR